MDYNTLKHSDTTKREDAKLPNPLTSSNVIISHAEVKFSQKSQINRCHS